MLSEINLVHLLNNVIRNLVKIFSLKQKTNKPNTFSPTIGKIKFCLFKETASDMIQNPV